MCYIVNTLHGNVQVQQKQASETNVTDKLMKLSVKESVNKDGGNGEKESSGQLDHPPSKKTKSSSRSRRRRKGRMNDPAAVVIEGTTCEFVRGGGGKMHSSSGPRRDWFSVDTSNKRGSFDNDATVSDTTFTRENKERHEGSDRKKTTPLPTLDGATKPDSAVVSRFRESKNQNSTKISDSSQYPHGNKISSSKEDKRQSVTQKNLSLAAGSEVSKVSKQQSAQLESG